MTAVPGAVEQQNRHSRFEGEAGHHTDHQKPMSRYPVLHSQKLLQPRFAPTGVQTVMDGGGGGVNAGMGMFGTG